MHCCNLNNWHCCCPICDACASMLRGAINLQVLRPALKAKQASSTGLARSISVHERASACDSHEHQWGWNHGHCECCRPSMKVAPTLNLQSCHIIALKAGLHVQVVSAPGLTHTLFCRWVYASGLVQNSLCKRLSHLRHAVLWYRHVSSQCLGVCTAFAIMRNNLLRWQPALDADMTHSRWCTRSQPHTCDLQAQPPQSDMDNLSISLSARATT